MKAERIEKLAKWSMTVGGLAAELTRHGRHKVTAADIRADIRAGAPVEKDGRVCVAAFTRWLIDRREHGDGSRGG